MKTTFKLGSLGGYFLPTLATQPYWGSNVFVDLNGDGYDDFIETGSYYPNEPYPATARQGFVLFGTATGFASAATQIPFASLLNVHAREFAFADFNEDGVQDFFIADHGYDASPFPGQQNLLFLSNKTSSGVSWVSATAQLPQTSDFSHSVTTGDINKDGHADLFVGNVAYSGAYFLLGDGKGNFTQIKTAGALGSTTFSFNTTLLTDFDLDGYPDLVLGATSASSAALLLWNNTGSFVNATSTSLPAPQNFGTAWDYLDAQSIDVNYDGLPDLVLANQGDVVKGGWQLQVLINQGGRNFTDETSKYIANAGARSGGDPANGGEVAWIDHLMPRDVNHDGRMDFVIEYNGWGKALPANFPIVLLHLADGTFDPLTAGDLRTAGVPGYMLDYSMHYVERGAGKPAEFINVFRMQDGSIGSNAVPITFGAAASYWSAGTPAADILKGTANADDIGGFGGDDNIDGGAGIDTARYNAKHADATLAKTSTGWTITSAQDGKDTLVNIERVKFADTYIALDLDGNAGNVAKILGAVFGKQYLASKDYVGLGLSLLDAGASYANLVAAAVHTDLFAQLAGSRSNTDFVNLIYKNVVGTAPSQAELNHYVGLLNSGAQTQESLALIACDTDINKLHIDLVGLAKTGIEFIPVA